MLRLKNLCFLLLLAGVLAGCGSLNKKVAPEPDGPKTTLVGIVEMVNPEQNYVLIRCEQMPAFGAGTELIAVDATGAESKLKLTQERKGRYLTADIQEGQPRVMNLVVRRTTGNVRHAAPPVLSAPVLRPLPGSVLEPIPLEPIPLEPVTNPQIPLEAVLPPVEPAPAPATELEPPVQ